MSEDLQRAQQRLQLDAIDEQIEALEGKAVTEAERLALLDLRVEQVGARLALARGSRIEAKAIRDAAGSWPPDKERALVRFIRAIGGYSADGGPIVGALDFDDAHFERATALIRGELEPETAAEGRALAAWKAKYA